MLTFALVALLAYPDGHEAVLHLGQSLSARTCEYEARKTETQLGEDLSIATLVTVNCEKEIEL